MNTIETLIEGYRAAEVAKAEEGKRQEHAGLEEAERLAWGLLQRALGEIWEAIKPCVSVTRVKIHEVYFRVAGEANQLDDFTAICDLTSCLVRVIDLNGVGLGSDLAKLLARQRSAFSEKRRRLLLRVFDDEDATTDQVGETCDQLLLIDPGNAEYWNGRREQWVKEAEERATQQSRRREAQDDYAAQYRDWLIRCEQVKAHNREAAQRIQDMVNTPRMLRVLEYGIRDNDGEVTAGLALVSDQIPDDGWWTLADGSKKRFFYPISLSDLREVFPGEMHPEAHYRMGNRQEGWGIYFRGDERITHWIDDGKQVETMACAEFMVQPDYPVEPDGLMSMDLDDTRRAVRAELISSGAITEDDN